MTKEEIRALAETFDDMFIILEMLEKKELTYIENKFSVKGF